MMIMMMMVMMTTPLIARMGSLHALLNPSTCLASLILTHVSLRDWGLVPGVEDWQDAECWVCAGVGQWGGLCVVWGVVKVACQGVRPALRVLNADPRPWLRDEGNTSTSDSWNTMRVLSIIGSWANFLKPGEG